MTTPLRLKHNPSHMPEDELLRSFVVRQDDLEAVLEVIAENRRSDSNQHLLVLGPRGMGKTTLVNRAISETRRDPKRLGAWLPVAFDEESYTVTTAGELWALALTHMAEQTGDRTLRQTAARLQSIQDHQQLGEAALARMLEHASAGGKRILLVLENIDMLFEQQMGEAEAWKVRHTLQNVPTIMVLATSPTRLDAFHDRTQAFYEFFREYTLDRLDLEQCRTVWRMVTARDLPVHQARPIQIFTGGNTRLLVILASFARERSFRELMDDLVGLIDENTPYFKHNVEALPSEERKVFVTLADIWSPATSRQVAEQSRSEVSKVSTFLGRLTQRGAVEVVRNIGPTKLYQVVERMYNLYHLLRRRGETRVRGVVEFMVRYYDGQGLRELLDGMADEACDLSDASRTDHVRTFLEVLRRLPSPDERHNIVARLNKNFLDLPDVAAGLKEILAEKTRATRSEPELRALIATDPNDAETRLELASAMSSRGAFAEALEQLESAFTLDPGSRGLALLFISIVSQTDPADAWSPVIERLAPAFVARAAGTNAALTCVAQAWLFATTERTREAQDIANKIIDSWPHDSDAVAFTGIVYMRLGQPDAAIEAIEQALDVDPSNAIALQAGPSFGVNDPKRTESQLRAFVHYHPTIEQGWIKLIEFLENELADPEASEEAMLAARSNHPDSLVIRRKLAWFWYRNARFVEAEVELRYLVDRSARTDRMHLVTCMIKLGRRAEAYQFLTAHLQADPSAELFAMAAIAAATDGRIDEAQHLLQRGDELDPFNFFITSAKNRLALANHSLPQIRVDIEIFISQSVENLQYLPDLVAPLLKSTSNELDSDIIRWIRRALIARADDLQLHFLLARALARTGAWPDARETLARVLADSLYVRRQFKEILAWITAAAAHGHGAMFAQVLADSPSASLFAPAIVACRRSAGEHVDPPQEIGEVADDILNDIEAHRARLSRSTNTAIIPAASPAQRSTTKATKARAAPPPKRAEAAKTSRTTATSPRAAKPGKQKRRPS